MFKLQQQKFCALFPFFFLKKFHFDVLKNTQSRSITGILQKSLKPNRDEERKQFKITNLDTDTEESGLTSQPRQSPMGERPNQATKQGLS